MAAIGADPRQRCPDAVAFDKLTTRVQAIGGQERPQARLLAPEPGRDCQSGGLGRRYGAPGLIAGTEAGQINATRVRDLAQGNFGIPPG